MIKLFWGPHTCAIGIHVLLEELGARYETEQIDVEGGATHKAPFLAVNPKGKVPTLVRADGSVLSEFTAIAWWLARTHPEHTLIPDDPDTQARMLEVMNYIEGTIHGQGFARMFMGKDGDVLTLEANLSDTPVSCSLVQSGAVIWHEVTNINSTELGAWTVRWTIGRKPYRRA